MFGMAARGVGCTTIARELNSQGFLPSGRPWTHQTVFNALTNPKYAGCNVWNRTTQKLRTTKILVSSEHWIRKPNAFTALVDPESFERAQTALPKAADSHWPNEKILKSVQRLLRSKGRLNDSMKTFLEKLPITLRQRFGSFQRLYELVGYRPSGDYFLRAEQSKRSLQLRQGIFATLQDLFPEHIGIAQLPYKRRSLLCVDGKVLVSVLMSEQKSKRPGFVFWDVEPNREERDYVTLLCRMNPAHDAVVSCHLFRRFNFRSHRCYENDPWLETGPKLGSLVDFYETLTRVLAGSLVDSSDALPFSNPLHEKAATGLGSASSPQKSAKRSPVVLPISAISRLL